MKQKQSAQNFSSNAGFTLVELLVVIAIIGMLSTLAVVSLNSARSKARDAGRISDVKQLQTALELYYADNSEYPDVAAETDIGTDNYDVLCDIDVGFVASTAACSGGTVYMGQVSGEPGVPDTQPEYKYQDTGSGAQNYQITFTLEGSVAGLAAGAHTATQYGIQ